MSYTPLSEVLGLAETPDGVGRPVNEVKSTFFRGNLVYNANTIHGDAMGKYLERPYGSAGKAN